MRSKPTARSVVQAALASRDAGARVEQQRELLPRGLCPQRRCEARVGIRAEISRRAARARACRRARVPPVRAAHRTAPPAQHTGTLTCAATSMRNKSRTSSVGRNGLRSQSPACSALTGHPSSSGLAADKITIGSCIRAHAPRAETPCRSCPASSRPRPRRRTRAARAARALLAPTRRWSLRSRRPAAGSTRAGAASPASSSIASTRKRRPGSARARSAGLAVPPHSRPRTWPGRRLGRRGWRGRARARLLARPFASARSASSRASLATTSGGDNIARCSSWPASSVKSVVPVRPCHAAQLVALGLQLRARLRILGEHARGERAQLTRAIAEAALHRRLQRGESGFELGEAFTRHIRTIVASRRGRAARCRRCHPAARAGFNVAFLRRRPAPDSGANVVHLESPCVRFARQADRPRQRSQQTQNGWNPRQAPPRR